MAFFKDDYVYLDVEGYTLFHRELDYASSSPLFSWRSRVPNKELHWGCQVFEKPNMSFWLSELCLMKGETYVRHLIPGVYVRPKQNTISEKTFRYVWRNIHERYTFPREEIIDQLNVKHFLLDKITPETVLFFKGGHLERMIGILCGAKEIVNIEDLGVSGRAVIPERLVTDSECKVHRDNFNHCPRQECQYFMDRIDEWLPNYQSE